MRATHTYIQRQRRDQISARSRSNQPIIIRRKAAKFLEVAVRKSWDFRPRIGPVPESNDGMATNRFIDGAALGPRGHR
jgi:hypothetical protein